MSEHRLDGVFEVLDVTNSKYSNCSYEKWLAFMMNAVDCYVDSVNENKGGIGANLYLDSYETVEKWLVSKIRGK